MTNGSYNHPRDDLSKAWRILVNPTRFTLMDRKALYDAGIENNYPADGHWADQKSLAEDVSRFVQRAVKHRFKGGEIYPEEDLNLEQDYIDSPGQLAVISSFSAIVPLSHPDIQQDSRPIAIDSYVRKRLLDYLYEAVKKSSHKKTIAKEMGRIVFSRDVEDDNGPPPGKTIVGIKNLEDHPGAYYKIPISHAKRDLLDLVGKREQPRLVGEPLQPNVEDPSNACVYVPLEAAWKLYGRYFETSNVARRHEEVVRNEFKDIELKHMQKRMGGLNRFIHERATHNEERGIFKEPKYEPRLKAVLMAIDHVDPEQATFGEPLSSKEVLAALDTFATETDIQWVQSIAKSIGSQKSLGKQLREIEDSDDSGHISITKDSSGKNQYVFEYAPSGFKQIEVTEIEDLLEFPCMENLHESLMESKPTRWELYSFVRYVSEVDNLDVDVEDFMDWFDQYPWYEPRITEYQVSYELGQKMADGERPFPISCSNDNQRWDEHCIGKENCDYSLYQSVELEPDIYERLDQA